MERSLRRGLPLQLALNGEFDFRGAPNVTAVEEVKGLEFDHVILPGAAASAYPVNILNRKFAATGEVPPPSPSLGYARVEDDCHLAAWLLDAIRRLQRVHATWREVEADAAWSRPLHHADPPAPMAIAGVSLSLVGALGRGSGAAARCRLHAGVASA